MKPIPTPLALLPLLVAALSLTACETTADPLTPDIARFTPAPMPIAPVGEAVCEEGPCLSQRQADELFNAAIDVALERGAQICWLADFYKVKVEGC